MRHTKQKLCVLFIGLFGLQLISSLGCNRCNEQSYFSVLDLFIENGRLLSEEPLNSIEIEVNDHIELNKFCMKLTTGLEYTVTPSNHLFQNTFFSFPTVFAGCNSLTPLPSQQITNLTIVSNADFIFENEIFVQAGHSLNNYILISYGEATKIPLSEFLTSEDSHPMEIPAYLFINGKPAYNQLHRFSVNYLLNDGQSFSVSTEKVIITPE